MGIVLASLSGNRVTDAKVTIPAWGVSYVDATVDGSIILKGPVSFVIADLSMSCTVLSGGPTGAAGRSYFRLVVGAGGWGQTISRRSYANDAGVRLSNVLGDAAAEAGETLDSTTVDQTARLGPYYVRPEGPACRVLEQVAPGAWYVGEDGETRLGARPASTLSTAAPRTSELDLARGTLTIASPTIAGILPGLAIDGLTAVDVEHELGEKVGLRSTIWGQRGGTTSRRLSAFRALFDQLDPGRKFAGMWEYRIVAQQGERLNLQAIRVSTGMPDLQHVMVRPGVAGTKAQHTLGARVVVGFVDRDPSRPVVLAFEDAEGAGFLPTSLAINASTSIALAGGGAAVGRVGDSVSVTFTTADAALINSPTGACSTLSPITLTGQITAGSPKVTSG